MDGHARPAWAGRLDTIQSSLAGRGLDGLVVSTPVNITYLTSFKGTAGLLFLTPSLRLLIVDGRYDQAARQAPGVSLSGVAVERVDRRYDLTLGAVIAREGIRRVGFEAGHVTVATLGGWQRAVPAAEWVATEGVVEKQREIKDAGEIAILRRGGIAIASVARDLD